jgi:hypothetical protein
MKDNRPIFKGIYCGLPFRFREDPDEDGIEGVGPMAFLLAVAFAIGLPFNGEVFQYEGGYFRALWHWLNHPYEDEE